MFWVVQENLFVENRRFDLVNALERLGIPYQMVSVSKGTIHQEVVQDGNIITNGSVMLSNIAIQRGWNPGSLFNDNFSYAAWSNPYREWLLNRDATFTTISDAIVEKPVFVRPILDTKSFTGKVMSRDEFLAFQQESMSGHPGSPKPDTQIILTTPKRIGQEHRHYIVDGDVVTSSRYKLSGQPNYNEGADHAVTRLARQAAEIWSPARAFVIDTYIAGDDIGIVEIGCICHAGLYASDVMRIVTALNSMV